MIYPYNKKTDVLNYGEIFRTVVPAYECIVINVSDKENGINDDDVKTELPRALSKKDNSEYTFYAYEEIRELLSENQIDEKANSVQKEYSERFDRINSCWSRPDKLWLFVKADNPSSEAQIVLNGKKVNWQQDYLSHNELCVKNMVFADITDEIVWDDENKIRLIGFDESAVYMHYPKSQNEKIPECGEKCKNQECYAPILSDEIKVLSATINDNNIIIPCSENVLSVKVNMPFEELEGVYASVPISIGVTGNELKRDMALEYKDGIWSKKFLSGERIHLIIDDFKLSIWVVTKDKKESRTYHMPIEWLLN